MFVVTFLHDGDLTANGLFGGAEHRTRCVARRIWESLVVFLDAIDSLDSLGDMYSIVGCGLVLRTKGITPQEVREKLTTNSPFVLSFPLRTLPCIPRPMRSKT